MYANDNKGSYPQHFHWGDLLGKRGKTMNYDVGPSGFVDEPGVVRERPLNRYLGTPEVCRCPDDKGDTHAAWGMDVESCFDAYGTSYLVQWQISAFAVQYVTGDAQGPVPRKPMRAGQGGGRLSQKIVMGDWNWHANRPVSHPRTLWHDLGKQRRFNMLFGDGHAEAFHFPAEYEQHPIVNSYDNPQYGGLVEPNPSRGFW
jgi:prepilin-type processing-associated H-X9-DG protein